MLVSKMKPSKGNRFYKFDIFFIGMEAKSPREELFYLMLVRGLSEVIPRLLNYCSL